MWVAGWFSFNCICLCWSDLDGLECGRLGLNWVRLAWVGLGWIELGYVGLGVFNLGCSRVEWSWTSTKCGLQLIECLFDRIVPDKMGKLVWNSSTCFTFSVLDSA